MKSSRQAEIKTKLETLGKELETGVRFAIEPITKWVVTDVTIGMTTSVIRLALTTDKTKQTDLTYYSQDCGLYKKGQLRTNIAAFGSFEVMSENDVAEYYMQVGNLLSNKDMLDYVKKLLKEFTGNVHDLVKEYRALSEKED